MFLKRKIVVIVDGTNESDREYLCEIVSKYYTVRVESSIDPIKEIARKYAGWDGGGNPKSRKFLSDLKQAFVEYNDMPREYIKQKYKNFMDSNADILFICINGDDRINNFRKIIRSKCVTLLIRSTDEDMEDNQYDYCFVNDCSANDVEEKFMNFFQNILEEQYCCNCSPNRFFPWKREEKS